MGSKIIPIVLRYMCWARLLLIIHPKCKSKGRPSMATDFKVGDLVEWNSEAGRVQGIIQEKITTEIMFKGYHVHASKEEPQYLIKSMKTDHLAMHKGSALKKIKKIEK
jgi:hypothetical protein